MHIMVVDDFTPMRKIMQDMLKRLGFRHVITAPDGNSALEKMRTEKVDLILSNCNMRPMSGTSLLKLVRENPTTKNIPVILTAGKKTTNIINEAKEHKVDNFIARPFNIKTLKDRLDSIKTYTPEARKKDDLHKIRKLLKPVTVGIATLRTLEKLLPTSSQQVESAAEDIYTQFSVLAKHINKDKNVPIDVAQAMNKIITAMQFQDRHSQYMQNTKFMIQHCIGILKDTKNTLHEITNSSYLDPKVNENDDSDILIKRISSDIRLSEMKILFNNILFGSGIKYTHDQHEIANNDSPPDEGDGIELF